MQTLLVRRSLLCWLAIASIAEAQLPLARLKAVFPPGGQVGSTFELRLTAGDDLEELAALHFTHPGMTAKPRQREVDGRLETVDNTFDVTIAGDVPPGLYEVYATGLWGASNPKRFAVTARPVVTESEPNNTDAQAQAVAVNVSVLGRMEGGTDVDCFRVTAQAGQRVVIDCMAERLDAPLDAVLEVRDASGRRLAASRQSGGDPTLVFDVPADGEYVVELHDRTYRNGADFVYRLDIHTGPQLALVMPPAGRAGTKSKFAVYGFNLPGGQRSGMQLHRAELERIEVEIDVPHESAIQNVQNVVRSYEADVDAFSWSLTSPQGASNPIRIGISDLRGVSEAEPNNEPAAANAIEAPGEVAGQFLERGDVDWFRFDVKPGDVYWIEVVGQRTGSTLDPVLIVEEIVRDQNGAEQVKRLTAQDDDTANVAQNVFDTFTDDPVYRLAAAREATCRVGVYDRYGQTRGDPQLRYRLCIRPEQPDFRVVAVPVQTVNNAAMSWPLNLRRGDAVSVPVYALRKYGFDGPIEVRVTGLPAGVHCAGTTIGSRESTGQLIFRSDEQAPESVATLSLVSAATIDSPAATRALEAARKAAQDAESPLAELRKKLTEAEQKLATATQARNDASMQSQAAPGDAGLSDALMKRQQELDAATQQLVQAADALAAAEKKRADAQAALRKAEADDQVARREVQHPVRTATIMLPGQANQPARARLAQALTLAVLREEAPFETRAEPVRVAVCQSRQILVPVQLIRRAGFDDKVTLTVSGVPRTSNLQVQAVTIEKGQSEALLPVFIKDNTPPGRYALWVTAQGQVNYSRNPEKTERIKKSRDEVAARLKAAQDAAKQATDHRMQLAQRSGEAEKLLQQAQQRRQEAMQLAQQRTTEMTQAQGLQPAADKRVEESSAALKMAEQVLAEARAALEQAADDADLQAKVKAAEEAVTAARQAADQAAAQKEALTKQLAEAQKRLDEANAAQHQASDAVQAAEAAKVAADKARAEAEAAEKAALEAVKPREAEKQAADKRVEEAEKVSKPQSKSYTPAVTPIVLDVLPAPVKLGVSVANGGKLKAGGTVEVTIKVERLNGFAGPVSVALALPPQRQGVSGAVEIPAGQNEGKLTLTAAGDAAEGALTHAVLRATVDWQGERLVDVPVAIQVTK